MIKICSQSNIPVVDNTDPTCQDVVREECIRMTSARTNPITIEVNDVFKTSFDRLLQKVADLETEITALKARVTALENA